MIRPEFSALEAQVISLPRRADRREQFAAHAQEQGMPYRFFDAITGSPTLTAITRSHKAVIRAAKQRRDPYVLVMEDDCWFPSKDGFTWFLEQAPILPFDLYLGGIYSGKPNAEGIVDAFCATHCYIAAASFYDRFLKIDEAMNVDHALAGVGRYYVCQPFAAIQRNGFSDNAHKVVDYDHHIAGKFRR